MYSGWLVYRWGGEMMIKQLPFESGQQSLINYTVTGEENCDELTPVALLSFFILSFLFLAYISKTAFNFCYFEQPLNRIGTLR